jgi:hypothetical protein
MKNTLKQNWFQIIIIILFLFSISILSDIRDMQESAWNQARSGAMMNRDAIQDSIDDMQSALKNIR